MSVARTAARLIPAGVAAFCVPFCAAWAPLGPFGGSASVVVADPRTPGTFLAGSHNALLFRSVDRGESWTPIFFPAQLRATLNALVIDPEARGVILAGLSGDLPQYSGILRSTDGGVSWRQAPDLRNEQVRAIAFKRADAQIVAAGTDSGVFASYDGGVTWRRISPADNPQLRPVVSVTFDPKDSETIFAGTPRLPWKTSDGGATWNSIHTGMLEDSDVFSIQVDRNRPQRVLAGACSGIYRSVNGAALWSRPAEGKENTHRTYVVAQDPQFENTWFAGTSQGIVRSVDGGIRWEKVGPYSTRAIAFDPNRLGRILIATDDAGILRTDDNGRSWRPVNDGFCNRRLSSLWITGGQFYTSALDSPSGGSVLQLAPDLGEWISVVPSQRMASMPLAVMSLPWSPQVVVAKSQSAIFISEDSGQTWNPLDLPVDGGRISGFSVLRAPWIAATGSAGLFLSRDGKVWVNRLGTGEVYGVVWTHNDGLLAATSSGLKVSDNLGISWRPVRGELESDTIQAICRSPNGSKLFAAKYGVIYSSDTEGRSWKRISPEGWLASSVKQLAVLPGRPDRLLVLTHQQGVWWLPL